MQPHVARMGHDHLVPDSLSNRLTHGECIPVTSAIRLRDIPPKNSFIAFGVVLIFCSNTIEPASSRTQYQLDSITQVEPESSTRGDSGVFPARLPSAETSGRLGLSNGNVRITRIAQVSQSQSISGMVRLTHEPAFRVSLTPFLNLRPVCPWVFAQVQV